jgi:hypothetical protein
MFGSWYLNFVATRGGHPGRGAGQRESTRFARAGLDKLERSFKIVECSFNCG